MRVLILGGTRFLGRHIAAEALESGHEVALFHRGLTNPALFPDAEHILGDRHAGDLRLLAGRQFDWVIDTGVYHPDHVRAAHSVASSGARYALVSSVSALREPLTPHASENNPLIELPEPLSDEATTAHEYGGLKAAAEAAALRLFSDRLLVLRPGILVGPHDPSGRVASWLWRLRSRPGVVAGDAAQPVQLLDARDLASWLMRTITDGDLGTFHLVGPPRPMVFSEFLSLCSQTVGNSTTIAWAAPEVLGAEGVELPLVLAADDRPFFEVSAAKAQAHGLRCRPLAQTLDDLWEWARKGPVPDDMLTESREEQLMLLARNRARQDPSEELRAP